MANNTFKRESRLLTSLEYDKVFKHNTVRASAKGIVILALKKEENTETRLGLVVPKKVLKRAVWRNRVKRIVRETFRISKHALPNIDVVFLAKPTIGDLSNQELNSTLLKLWEKISHRLDNPQS